MSALNGILAQRLLRLNCEACAEAIAPSGESLAAAGISTIAAKAMRFMAGKGCGQCRGTGYRGRFAIGELLILTDALREMIVGRAPVTTLKEVAKQNGTRFLRESALALVSAGRTTLDEIGRVTFSD
jgi:general secretion pathway protein E